MKNCTNCGKQLDDSVMFCDACGTKLAAPTQQPTKFCNACGKQLPANAAFCDACGNRFGAQPKKQSAGITPAMVKLFKFISGAACKLAMFFAALSILFLGFSVKGMSVGVAVEPVTAILSFIFALGALGLDIVAFIADKKSDIFTRISILIPSGLMTIFGIFLMFNL